MPRFAAAVPAGDHGVDDTARLDQQVQAPARLAPATGERVARRCRSLDLTDTRHQIPFTSFATTSRTLVLGAGGEGQRHAVLQHRPAHGHRRWRVPAVHRKRARPCAQHQRLAGARPGPQATCLSVSALPWPGRAETHQRQDRLDDAFRHRHAADQRLDFSAAPAAARSAPSRPRCRWFPKDAALGLDFWIEDVDLHQEAVELGPRVGIGAFLLQRVLRCQHMEGRRQVMAGAGNGDVGTPASPAAAPTGCAARRG